MNRWRSVGLSLFAALSLSLPAVLVSACSGVDATPTQPVPSPPLDERTPEQVVVSWLRFDPTEPVWLEETLAAWPQVAGDRDVGARQIVRRDAAGARHVLWVAPDADRITAAIVSDALIWVAAGVDADRRPFVARGDRDGLQSRMTLSDPGLPGDPNAWYGSDPPRALHVSSLSEDSVRIAGTVDQPFVSLVSDQSAVLAYALTWSGDGQFTVGPHTLVSPAMAQTPYLPIGASYDNFDAVVHDFSARLASTSDGDAYIAIPASAMRMRAHNRVFGTRFEPLRSDQDLLNRPSDLLLSRVRRDGHVAWTALVGVPDVDDEIYALAVGPADRVALAGRTRRERGRDNSEWHISLHIVDGNGAWVHSQTYDAPDCAIAQSAAFVADGSLLIGGTANWLQNPSGISLYQNGKPLLLQVDIHGTAPGASIRRRDDLLPRTAGHAELRALAIRDGQLWLGGLEHGPLTHTGDSDRSLIRADGWRVRATLR